MKIFHTADWHLGKIIHGVSMIEEQRHFIAHFIETIKIEQPDCIVIAGDLYDRAIPPPEAVELLNSFLDEVVLSLNIPVIAIAGNHDSPSRIHFGSNIMRKNGFYIVGRLEKEQKPIVLKDEAGEVHFHLIPYADPSIVRHIYDDETIKTYDDAMKAIIDRIQIKREARHVFVGHAFVTPYGEKQDNTSDSERLLSVGGVEYVNAEHFLKFHYVALGHLHKAHYVRKPYIRYAGSPLKYSISEEHHEKGFYVVNLEKDGSVEIDKKVVIPRRDIRTVEGTMGDILQQERSEDYVFVKLKDRSPILSPMEKVRTVFPNALHVERLFHSTLISDEHRQLKQKEKQSDVQLFQSFYEEVSTYPAKKETVHLFQQVLEELIKIDNETRSN